MSETFRAGTARHCVTPPLGAPLGGYPERPAAVGVTGDLWARAIVLSQGEATIAVVALDLLGVDRELTGHIRDEVAVRTGIPPAAVMVVGTHTHSSPAWVPRLLSDDTDDDASRAYRRQVEAGASQVVVDAMENRSEVSLWSGRASTGRSVAANRTTPDGPVDPTVTVVTARTARGPQAMLVHYPCHPTVSGDRRITISPDFPEATLAVLRERTWYEGVFVNGAAGDISTRFTRHERSDREATRLGTIVGEAGVEAVEHSSPLATGPLRWASRELTLPLPAQSATDLDAAIGAARGRLAAAQGAEARVAETRLEGLLHRRDTAARLATVEAFTTEIQVLACGSLALVGIPGEPFSDRARQFERDGVTVLTIGYANDYVGYLPVAEAFADDGYEVSMAPLGEVQTDRLFREAEALLDETLAAPAGGEV